MLKKLVAVIVGYLVMFVVVFMCLTAGYLALGADKVFQPGSYEVTALWLIVWFIVSLGAALAGALLLGVDDALGRHITKPSRTARLGYVVCIRGLCLGHQGLCSRKSRQS